MPHSKVIATLVLCLAIIASTVIYERRASFFGPKTVTQAQVVVETASSTIPAPNDDWKRMLNSTIGTNGPIQVVAGQESSTTQDDNSLTAQIAKEFFSLYLQDKKNGVTIDQNEALAIANQALQNVQGTATAVQYEVTDIKISLDSSDTAMKTYAKAMMNAAQSHSAHKGISPVTLIDTASKSGNDSDLAGIDFIISDYKSAIKAILQIPVPQKAVGYHMVYLNTLSDILFDLQGMRQTLTDPITSYVAFSNYQKDMVTMEGVTKAMVANFPKSN